MLDDLWNAAGLPNEALAFATLTGADPVFASSFAVGQAAQTSIAAAALAACELGHARGTPRQQVAVDMAHAAAECTAWYTVDGVFADPWAPISGLYRCADGWVRVHANFTHHRDGFLRLLNLDPATAQRADAEAAALRWRALDLETALADRGLVGTALRSFAQWDASPQGQAIAALPLFSVERIGDAAPLPLRPLRTDERPLVGVRVLDLTRVLAGPVGGRALAAYGADVLLVNSPNLPNIEAIADTSRGKLSALADLHDEAGRQALRAVAADTHVFVQGYRPGGLAALGFGPAELARLRPGIVYVSLSAYGASGPWSGRKGFDSLVQTATGFNLAEQEAAGDAKPRALPMQILDEATGYLIAFLAAATLRRQQLEGGSWHVQVSLAQTAHWLRSLGRVADGFAAGKPNIKPWLQEWDSGWGKLVAPSHSAVLSRTPARWARASMPPGSHPLAWPPDA